jgi:Zn-dependent peptidase ImmA (M78 family)
MAVSGSNSFIKKRAREVLSDLYRVYYEEKGQYLSPEEFFPIDPGKIISSVMNWELQSVSDIGYDGNGQRMRGQCDYKNRLISVATGDINAGEKTFTIAHEIGHAVLHTNVPRKSGVSERKRAVRRITCLTSTREERKREKEANIFAAELLMPEKAVRDRFLRTFGRARIWLGSAMAQKIINNFSKGPQRLLFPLPGAKDIAPYFADYKKTEEDQSMKEFFGVSKTAMSIRLLELNLVYE